MKTVFVPSRDADGKIWKPLSWVSCRAVFTKPGRLVSKSMLQRFSVFRRLTKANRVGAGLDPDEGPVPATEACSSMPVPKVSRVAEESSRHAFERTPGGVSRG